MILTLSRQLGRMRGSLLLLIGTFALACPGAVLADASGDFEPGTGQGHVRELPAYLQCVPYARERSGVRIYGDARTWWDQAAGRYKRGYQPRPGAVMTFRPHGGMVLGHVAAVAKVLDSRTVLLDHANWSPIDGRRGQIERGVKAVDVSLTNDWSQVRVWYDPLGGLGTTAWPVAGFIYNERTDGTAAERPLGGPRVLASANYTRPVVQSSGEPSKRFAVAFANLGQPRVAAPTTARPAVRKLPPVRQIAASSTRRDPITQALARYDR
jgi:surface antigen